MPLEHAVEAGTMEQWDSETQKLQLSDGKWTYKGGDTRHMDELNTVRGSAQRCEERLKEKRERNQCE